MIRKTLIVIVCFLSIKSYAQITFEKGYFISNSDEKTDCFIKNVDWKNNPTEFEYKLTENSESKIASIRNIKEFGIDNYSKYKRFEVQIDRSSNELDYLTGDRNPVFNTETLFLKAIIEGKADLYYYEDGNLRRLFYVMNDSDVQSLVYKRYLVDGSTKIGENNFYKQQLLNHLKCSSITSRDIEKINYTIKDLNDIVLKYNDCENTPSTTFTGNTKKNWLNLNIRPGINFSTLSIKNNASQSRDTDFGNNLGFRLGVEAEVILPFNNIKFAIIFEPTYQSYNNECETINNSPVSVDYSSIELPVGVRHYFFLNNTSKLFVNASIIFDFAFNSKIDFEYSSDLDISSKHNYGFGIGYNYDSKYSFELRYLYNRDIFRIYRSWTSNYSALSVIVGYNLF